MRVGLLVAVLLAPALAPAPSGAARTEVDPWWETTLMDADRDRVDDALEPLLAGLDPLTVLVAYASMPGAAERASLEARGAVVTFAPRHFPLLVALVAPHDARGLLQADGVVFVERNDVLRPMLQQSAPLIGATQAWEKYSATGKGVVVAVLDDGAYEQHPDLQAKLVRSFNAAVGGGPVSQGSGVVVPAGEEGHGTHVAGTVVGTGGQSGGDYRGIAPDARFVNVRVFSAPNQTNSDIVLRGLDWVLDNRDALKIKVASMSLGGRPSDGKDALSRAVDLAVDEGLVVVAAAGNGGPGPKTVSSPGAAQKAITVGAVDKRKAIAEFSSRGPTVDGRVKPDLVAPGKDIVAAVPPASTGQANGVLAGKSASYYGSLSGTSMATPHVAGVVALMLQVDPGLTPHQVKRILLATAQDVGKKGIDNETGYGFVNAIAAVQVTKTPSILDQAQYRSILATIPDPEPEGIMEKLSYQLQRLRRDGTLPLLVAVAVGVMVATVAVAALARRLRQRRA